MDIGAIIFDKDGTLVDFEATFTPATRVVLEQICGGDDRLLHAAADAVGYDIAANRILKDSVIIAGTGIDIARELGRAMPIGDPVAYGSHLDRLYGNACRRTVKALPGVVETIAVLAANRIQLAVGTNDAHENAAVQIEVLGMKHHFSRIYGADSGYGSKPGPGMVKAFMADIGLKADQVMMVGDSLHDLEAGRTAGALCVAVETGPATRAELEPHADYLLPSIIDLPSLLGIDQ